MDFRQILDKELPEKTGTTLIKVYRGDQRDFKDLAKKSGMTMQKLFSLMVYRARRQFEKENGSDKRP